MVLTATDSSPLTTPSISTLTTADLSVHRPIVTGPHKITEDKYFDTALYPRHQDILRHTHSHCTYQITIRGLPAPYYINESGQHPIVISESAIGNIVHKYKHLYTNGDTDGKREYHRKRHNGEQVQNRYIRIPFSYTITESRSELIINLIWSNSFRKTSTIRYDKKDTPRPMTFAEVDHTMAVLSEMITYDIQAYLDEIYTSAQQTGTTPDYYGIYNQ